jgi:hypothetical protein
MTFSEVAEATERGRQMAVNAMIANLESRKRVEAAFGIKFARNRFPEVYNRRFKEAR